MSKEHSTTSFQEDWLTDDRYKIWVRRVPDKPHKAYCTLCKRSIDIATGGATALDSHQGGKGHGEKLKERKKNQSGSFFQASSDMDVVEGNIIASSSTSSSTQPKLAYDVTNDVIDAEILWCLYMVENHQSYRPIPTLIKRMFKVDPAAQGFQMGEDKSR